MGPSDPVLAYYGAAFSHFKDVPKVAVPVLQSILVPAHFETKGEQKCSSLLVSFENQIKLGIWVVKVLLVSTLKCLTF